MARWIPPARHWCCARRTMAIRRHRSGAAPPRVLRAGRAPASETRRLPPAASARVWEGDRRGCRRVWFLPRLRGRCRPPPPGAGGGGGGGGGPPPRLGGGGGGRGESEPDGPPPSCAASRRKPPPALRRGGARPTPR